MAKIAIDPVTRIEGHLRIEAQIDNGRVTDAWSVGTMFRGLEIILRNRDPREAWMLAQRICGVCTTVHAICSVRAVENALGLTIPANARILRNVIEAAQFVHDHVIHFYHLHALDWVDVTSALNADPAKTSSLQKTISDWPNNSAAYFTTVRDRLKKLVASSQLGLFANGYWGHPAYTLPPEANLLLVAHYLEALNFQRDFVKIHAILGGKNPHPQTYAVGGMAIPLSATNSNALTPTKIDSIKALVQQARQFVRDVYLRDVILLGQSYRDWATRGQGVGDLLSVGDFPMDDAAGPENLFLPRGLVMGRDLSRRPDPLDPANIREYVTRSWYNYTGGDKAGLHPAQGQTSPNYTGAKPPYTMLNTDAKYSWLKAPRYADRPMEVGPLARMAVAYAAGHAYVQQALDAVLDEAGLQPSDVFSTLGRVVARAVETSVLVERLPGWLDELSANIRAGKTTVHNGAKWSPSTWPASATGWGSTEAPRGALFHWLTIANGKIGNYQCVVPTTWNGSPRDHLGQRGPFEEALLNTPVADPARPLELIRTIHSFDPCMACAVHVLDAGGAPLARLENALVRA
jgi:hydrogenase large subunit